MWTLDKLEQHITEEIEESLYLDYKAADSLVKSDSKKNEIAKDVSAFANSDGGIIIYGVKEFQSGSTFLPEKIDPVDRGKFSKETLEQIINTRISPRIHGVVITPITIGEAKNNQVVYVVEIPKSDTAHQSSDKRYYRRFNFQSISMDDWEIKDIINRQNKSVINISFRPRFDSNFTEKYLRNPNAKISFDILATNMGNKVVKYCDCIIIGNERVSETIIPRPNLKKDSQYFELYYTNEIEYKVSLEENEFVINTQRMAILPFTFRKIGEIEFNSNFFINDFELKVTVAMDDNRLTKKLKGRQLFE